MIGWLVKRTALKYGGGNFAQRLVPFFLGLVLGDYFIGSVWALISPLLNFQGYQIFH
jgi:hypothetical protein